MPSSNIPNIPVAIPATTPTTNSETAAMLTASTSHFSDLLIARCDALSSIACVGLDPVLEQLPADLRAKHQDPVAAIRAFCFGVIDAVASIVPVIKPQSACFERFGGRGVIALEECCQHARRAGLLVLLDYKRGDIGISASHYAAAAQRCGAHAVTVSGYMGPDTIAPFIAAGLGIFVLVRTSNPGSDAIQTRLLADGRTIAELMADEVCTLGATSMGTQNLSNVGAVVGATKSADALALRARMPNQVFLVPGFGAQGGTADDVARMVRTNSGVGNQVETSRAGTTGVLVNASRSVIYPPASTSSHASWEAAITAAATSLNTQLEPVWKR